MFFKNTGVKNIPFRIGQDHLEDLNINCNFILDLYFWFNFTLQLYNDSQSPNRGVWRFLWGVATESVGRCILPVHVVCMCGVSQTEARGWMVCNSIQSTSVTLLLQIYFQIAAKCKTVQCCREFFWWTHYFASGRRALSGDVCFQIFFKGDIERAILSIQSLFSI